MSEGTANPRFVEYSVTTPGSNDLGQQFVGGTLGFQTPQAGGHVDAIEAFNADGADDLDTINEDDIPRRNAQPGYWAKVELAESVSGGDELAANADGQAVLAASGDVVVAVALEGGTSGDVIWFKFTGNYRKP